MPTGILKIWNDERGFGFLTDDQSPRGADVFVHSTTFKIAHLKPAIGDGFAMPPLNAKVGDGQRICDASGRRVMQVSVVLFYNSAQQYGFIKAEPCNIFFVASSVEGSPVKAGDAVQYEAVPAGRNSPRATIVRVIGPSVIGESERILVPPDRDL